MPGYKKPMMGHKKPKMAHGKKPKMGHKPKMAHGDKPKMAHGDKPKMYCKKPKMAHAKKPQFNAKLKQAAKEGKLDDNPKFKAAVEKAKPKMYNKKPKMGHTKGAKPVPKGGVPGGRKYGPNAEIERRKKIKDGRGQGIKKMPDHMRRIPKGHAESKRLSQMTDKGEYFPPNKPEMYNKKPFMMKPGSKQVDSPGPFKANEAAMMFKNNMPKDHRAGHPSEREKIQDEDRKFFMKGDVSGYGKRLRQNPNKRLNLGLPAIDDKAVTKSLKDFPELKRPTTQQDSIRLTKFQLKGGIHSSDYNKYQGDKSKAERMRDYGRIIGVPKRNKPKMYGSKPKMYGKKK